MTTHYFVTGATGFIGKRLVKKLLERKGTTVHFLIRKESAGKVAALREYWGVSATRAIAVHGDLTSKKLGVSAEDTKKLKGQVGHFYTWPQSMTWARTRKARSQSTLTVRATRWSLPSQLRPATSIMSAPLLRLGFMKVCSAKTCLKKPRITNTRISGPSTRAKKSCARSARCPGLSSGRHGVGDSTTGEMDKIDGPYYFFKLIQRMRQLLPPWMPAVGLEGGRVNIVPVDFVVDALDHISHKTGIAKKCFHLVDPVGYRVGDVLDIFSRAAHAPKMNLFVNAALLGFIPRGVKKSLMALAPVRRIRNAVLADLGLPEDMLTFVNYPTRFDNRDMTAALKGSGIECPNLKDYAWRLWDYWERHLDPDLHIDRSLKGTVNGKVVLVTGGSSGIGLAAAHKFAEAGAITIICGRDQDKLDEACKEAKAKGYNFVAYPADIADMADCDRFIGELIDKHGGVDFLINNAGRSIRRAIESSYDRFHDYERTMQLNYFGCLRVTMGLLPGMTAKRKGHVVNISSIGVLTNAPRFSAYVASKAALDAWTRCASSEFADVGISFTTINMPLVRTPMIAPTNLYNNVPTLSPEEAADMIADACITKPVRIATRLGITGQVMHALVPRIAQIAMNTSFRMFPDSSAAKGAKPGDKVAKPQLSAEAVAMQQMMRGIHF